MGYPLASNEVERLKALHGSGALEAPHSPALERICKMTQDLFAVPIAAISLVGEESVRFVAKRGVSLEEAARRDAFCRFTILHDEAFVVPDASSDREFAGNPFVAGEPHVRFYAGAPISTRPGIRIGSLCIVDVRPRSLSDGETRLLAGLARAAADELWMQELERSGVDAGLCSGGAGAPPDPCGCLPLMGAQVRSARGLLNWSVRDLAEAAGVSPMTVKRIEASLEVPTVREDSMRAVRQALEKAGVEFTRSPGRKPGVRPA